MIIMYHSSGRNGAYKFAIHFYRHTCDTYSNVPEPLNINIETQIWQDSFVFWHRREEIEKLTYIILDVYLVYVSIYYLNVYNSV